MPNVQRIMLKLFAKLPGGILVRMAGGKAIEIRGRTLDPMMQLLWVEGKKQPSVTEATPEQARGVMDEAASLLSGPVPPQVSVDNRVVPGAAGDIPIRIYSAPATGSLPMVLFFHQGGFVIGGLETCHAFCALLAEEAQCVVVNVDYRMAPEHRFPAPVEDAFSVYQWAVANGAEVGGDPARIAVCGDSAGGMLSALICQEAQRSGWQLPVCQVLLYPWLIPHSGLPSYEDFGDAYPLTADIMKWFSSLYFTDETQFSDPLASPGEQADLSGLPPAVIAAAGFDPLSDEAGAYAERLKEAGVPVTYRCFESLPHSFCMMGLVPAALAAQHLIAADVRALIH